MGSSSINAVIKEAARESSDQVTEGTLGSDFRSDSSLTRFGRGKATSPYRKRVEEGQENMLNPEE